MTNGTTAKAQVPSAAMLPFALAFALFAGKGKALRQWTGFGAAIRGAWPPVAGVFLGVAYYLTLREEFQRAMRESGGWTSAWMVGLHVVFAFALHLGVEWTLKSGFGQQHCAWGRRCHTRLVFSGCS